MTVLVKDLTNSQMKELDFDISVKRPICTCGKIINENPNDQMVIYCSCGKRFEVIE